MGTPFSEANKLFTDKCHILAQRLVYPKLFNVPFEYLSFEDVSLGTSEKNIILDGQMAIDRKVKVKIDDFNAPIEFVVQERFRSPQFAHWRDITITEWNNITDLPSELYKLNAGIFIYGYANKFPEPTNFIEVIAVDTPQMIIKIIRGELAYDSEENPRSNQTFITITFSQLFQHECIISTYK